MLKVLTGQDSPHFNFDAVIDMGVQQEGVFASKLIPCHVKLCPLLLMTIVSLSVKDLPHLAFSLQPPLLGTDMLCGATVS